MSSFNGFPPATFRFLEDLEEDNRREWFAEHKSRYEQDFLEPALEFIAAVEKPMARVAPMLSVQPKKVGGSLMRIYKDTRFSKDKTPYKTNIGIQFRHAAGKDVRAPGVYVHVDAKECFFGAGVWRPEAAALRQIRDHIVENPEAWHRLWKSQAFRKTFEFHNEQLKTSPRGYEKDHPLIELLRQKSFLVTRRLTREEVQSPELAKQVPKLVAQARPLMVLLCGALRQPY